MKTVHDIDPMLPPLTSPLGHQVCQHISTSLTVVHYKMLTVTPSMNMNQNIVCWQYVCFLQQYPTQTLHTLLKLSCPFSQTAFFCFVNHTSKYLHVYCILFWFRYWKCNFTSINRLDQCTRHLTDVSININFSFNSIKMTESIIINYFNNLKCIQIKFMFCLYF